MRRARINKKSQAVVACLRCRQRKQALPWTCATPTSFEPRTCSGSCLHEHARSNQRHRGRRPGEPGAGGSAGDTGRA
jgi:hypothetical protein